VLEYGGIDFTFEESYKVADVHALINNTVRALNEDSNRKFNWSNAAFLERWWNDSYTPNDVRQNFK
jgi:hypothetical protein